MRSKYNYDELVKVSGIGRLFGKVKNKLGFIIEKDTYYNDYYVQLIFGQKDWFDEKDLKRILELKKYKVEKYQIRLCTTKYGYELIKKKLEESEPIKNNKFTKISIKKTFYKDNNEYIILGWKSTYWPTSNKSVDILETMLSSFKSLNIPFQYIVMNEENIKDIEIRQFIENDNNVNVFFVERKIKIKI